MNISVRPMNKEKIPLMVDYFLNSSSDFLRGMGADPTKLPERNSWIQKLEHDFSKNKKSKEYFYIIWLENGRPIGHTNINKIEYGKKALMHLHLWENTSRQKGIGSMLLKKSIPLFFNLFELEKLICEPFAENIAPNKTLLKVGFTFIKSYETTPGPINLFQRVNRYEFLKEQLILL